MLPPSGRVFETETMSPPNMTRMQMCYCACGFCVCQPVLKKTTFVFASFVALSIIYFQIMIHVWILQSTNAWRNKCRFCSFNFSPLSCVGAQHLHSPHIRYWQRHPLSRLSNLETRDQNTVMAASVAARVSVGQLTLRMSRVAPDCNRCPLNRICRNAITGGAKVAAVDHFRSPNRNLQTSIRKCR